MNVKQLRRLAERHREIAAKQAPKGEMLLLFSDYFKSGVEVPSAGPEPFLQRAEAAEAEALAVEMFGEAFINAERKESLRMHNEARAERRRRGIAVGAPTYVEQKQKRRKRGKR